MEFRLLGPFEVRADGRDVTPHRPRERAVLAVLLLRNPDVVGVEELLDAVWGEAPPPTARTALHGLVSSLRRTVGAERLETRPPGYRLRLTADDRFDVAAFQRLVEQAAGAAPGPRGELLREALGLVRGRPLGDLDLALDLHAEVARLDALRLAAEEDLAGTELELGQHREVIPRLQRLVAEQPLRESLRGLLALALYRAGRQADALAVLQDARTVLATELGVEPGPALQRLERQVLDQDPVLMGDGHPVRRSPPPAGSTGLSTFFAAAGAGVGEAGLRRLRAVTAGHGATELRIRGQPVFAFARARDAAAAAAAIQRESTAEGPAFGIGLHAAPASAPAIAPASARAAAAATGVPAMLGPLTMHEAALASRLAAVAHPGQVLLSRATWNLLGESGFRELDVRELGEHRLSDLRPAQPLFQLLAHGLQVDFPPTRSLATKPTNLPQLPSTFIDREVEVEAIAGLLRSPAVRLVTLTGPGGIGKTRLALHAVAELLDEDPTEVWLVALESIADPGLVPATIAATLGVADAVEPLSLSLARELAGRRVVLLLDNFEHVMAAAGFVGDLLARSDALTILVTSRVPLKLEGERVVPVPPLPLPADEAAPGNRPDGEPGTPDGVDSAGPAMALFLDRAAALRPEYRLLARDAPAVARLCRALDGLPLAIELAASRVALMSAGALLERMDQPLRLLERSGSAGPARHRALTTAIDWSHDLLDGREQRLFADLAVFAGGWTLDAAEAITGAGRDAVPGLAKLLDHSLVRLAGGDADPRFEMLRTIRDYAAARLDASGARPDVEWRHAGFYLDLAESLEPQLRGNPGAALTRLHAEHDNLRAALDRLAARSNGDARGDARGDALGGDAPSVEVRLAGALWRYWYLAGQLAEGRARLEHALTIHPDPTPGRVKCLLGAAVMAINAGDAATTAARATEALELAGSMDDAWSVAYARFMVANAASATGDDRQARSDFETSMMAFRDLGDGHSALLVARNLAGSLLALGEREAAAALYQDNLRRARADGNGRVEASTLGALATIAFDEGRVTDATLLLGESLRLHRELRDRLDTAVDLARAAQTLAFRGVTEPAGILLGVLEATSDGLGVRGRTVRGLVDATRARLSRQLPTATIDRLVADGSRLGLFAAVDVALRALPPA